MDKSCVATGNDTGFVFVLVGGTGDLAMRKVLPALYAAHRDGLLDTGGQIISIALDRFDRSAYVRWLDAHVKPHISAPKIAEKAWRQFLDRIDYLAIDTTQVAACNALQRAVVSLTGTRIFYLATGPSQFIPICRALALCGLNDKARIVLETPLGCDLASLSAINDAIGDVFSEEQIYRIDHYLGKEWVQNCSTGFPRTVNRSDPVPGRLLLVAPYEERKPASDDVKQEALISIYLVAVEKLTEREVQVDVLQSHTRTGLLGKCI